MPGDGGKEVPVPGSALDVPDAASVVAPVPFAVVEVDLEEDAVVDAAEDQTEDRAEADGGCAAPAAAPEPVG